MPQNTVTFGSGDLQPLVPARLLDTREGIGAPVGTVHADSTIVLQVTGRGGVPNIGVGAVVLNVTVTEPTALSYVTVFPTGELRPTASNLNTAPGDTIPNLVVAKLGLDGTVSLYNQQGSTHLVADVAGWFPEGAGLQPMSPVRLMDTREGNGAPVGPVGEGSTTVLQVAGRGGIPADGAGAVVLNVTVTEPTSASYVTVFPTGEERPTASNLNMTAGQTVPNLVIAKLGAGGMVSLYNNQGFTHLVVDVAGWFPTTSAMHSLSPQRILDTREGNGAAVGAVTPASTTVLQVTGRGGVPATGVGAVVLNVTVTGPTAPSFITVFPTGENRPTASNLNMVAGQTVPNLVIAKLGSDGTVSVYNNQGFTHLVADVAGWFPTAGANLTTLELVNGTVLAGAGDVVSFTGSSETGGTVTLAASADVPPVGGHLAVAAHDVVPNGMFGRVSQLTPQVNGTTAVTLVPATLEAGFADIDSHFAGIVSPGGQLQTQSFSKRTELAAECSTSAGVSIQPIISIAGGAVTWDLDFSERHLLFDLPLQVTVGFSASFTGSLSCTVEVPEYPIPIPFATVSATPRFTLTVSGGLTVSATLSAAVNFGFEANGNNVANLSSFAPSATGDLDADVSASITFRPALQVKLQLFGVAGGFVDLGVNFTGTVEPLAIPCINLTVQLTLDFGFSLGKWGLAWDITLASIQGPEIVVTKKTEGCPTGDHAWVGSIDVVNNRDTVTEVVLNDDGDVVVTLTVDRDFSYRIESTSTSLVNRTLDSVDAPADVTVSFRSYNDTSYTHVVGVEDGTCNTTHGTAYQTPWQLVTNLTADPAGGDAVDNPADGDLVYLLVNPYLGLDLTCRDGEVILPRDHWGNFATGDEYDNDLECLSGAVVAGNRGYCYLPVTISDNGTRMTFNGTLTGIFDYNAHDVPVTETVIIDLHRISL